MKMISTSDNSSSEEEDSQELQRLKDAAVTLEPSGDLHASQTISTNISGANKEANNTKECSRPSLRPSLRPKQTYSEDPCELKMTPGFKTHVAKKLSDILDKELEFSESAVEKSNENESSDSGIRLLSSSKDFLSTVPNADIPNLKKDSKWSPVWKPKSHAKLSSREKHASSVSRKRTVTNNNKETNSSSEKHGSSSSDSVDAKRQKYNEESLKIAIECVRSKSLTLGKASKRFEIPKSTLQDKVTGKYATKKEKTILTRKEEKKLADWLIIASRRGCGCTKQLLLRQVQMILNIEGRETVFNNNLPGNKWYYAFLRRQGNMSLHQTQRLGSGKVALTEETIRQWFKDARKQLKEEASDVSFFEDPHRIFSCDEFGFSLCQKTGKVLGCKTDKQVKRASDHIKTQITILTCASAAGNIMKPMLIFPGIKFHYNPLAGFKEAVFAKSSKGWLESNVFESWLTEVFIPFVRPLRKPVLLFLDGQFTRVSLRTHELCIENHILYYSLPHRALHLVQPLDLYLFKSFKLDWKKATVEFHEDNQQAISKTTFASVLKKVWTRTVTTQKIIRGFQASGIYPWNPDAVNYQKIITKKSLVQLSTKGPACTLTQPGISDQQKNLELLLDFIQLITREKLMVYRKLLSDEKRCPEPKFLKFSSLYRKVAGIPEKNTSFDNLPLPEECMKTVTQVKTDEKEKKEKKNKTEQTNQNKSTTKTTTQQKVTGEGTSENEDKILLDDEIVATVNNILMFENNCCVCNDDSDKSGWVGCDKCERWFHKECASTDEDLTLMDEADLESFPFICEYCS